MYNKYMESRVIERVHTNFEIYILNPFSTPSLYTPRHSPITGYNKMQLGVILTLKPCVQHVPSKQEKLGKVEGKNGGNRVSRAVKNWLMCNLK